MSCTKKLDIRGHDYSPNTLEFSYHRWVNKQMEKRSLEYSDIDHVSIFCGTWNVNSKVLSSAEELSPWLLPEGVVPADIYVIGLQEMVDLNVMNVVIRNTASDDMAAHWLRSIATVLAKSGTATPYKLLVERHMVGILFIVFVKESLYPCVHDLQYAMTYTGSYGVTGNKGAICAHMLIHDSPVCFVCSHFHANRENVVTRNLDFQHIIDNSKFFPCSPGACGPITANSSSSSKKDRESFYNNGVNSSAGNKYPPNSNVNTAEIESVSLLDHEHVFWLGDLNYRISEELSTSEVFAHLGVTVKYPSTSSKDNSKNIMTKGSDSKTNGSEVDSVKVAVLNGNEQTFGQNNNGELTWEALRSKDQLNIERRKKNVFQGFEEGDLTFPPTYKYQPGTDLYETRADKKLRAPAWCDRILWRSCMGQSSTSGSHNSNLVRQLHYRCASSLKLSDHKPVSALFSCDVRKVVPARLKDVHQELLIQVDKWVNASAPKINLEGRIIDFGEVSFDQQHRTTMIAHNIGTVMASWSFVPKNDETQVCKPWLRMHPSDGILAPDERCEIEVTIDLNLETAGDVLESGENIVEEIIVFRVMQGSDFFCIVNGTVNADSAEVALRQSRILAERTPMPAHESKVATSNPIVAANRGSIFSMEQIYDNDDD